MNSKRINEPVNEMEKLIIKAIKDDASITYSELALQLNKEMLLSRFYFNISKMIK